VTEAAPPKKKSVLKLVFALFGVGVVLGGCCCVVAAIVIPNSLGARKHGNETAAIGALKTIATAESIFREGDKDQNGTLDYGSLAQLSQTQLVDEVLGSGTKQGFLFQAAASVSTSEFLWFVTATPTKPTIVGDRYFCMNHAAVIFYTTTASFSLNTTDCAIPATALPVGK
jgi:hypothetical protein